MNRTSTIERRVSAICKARRERGLSLRGLAESAGVPASTIQQMDAPGWNPTLRTLIAVEVALFGEHAGDAAA